MFFGPLVDHNLPSKLQLMGEGVFIRYEPGETEELFDLLNFINSYAKEYRVTEEHIPPTVLNNVSILFSMMFSELISGIDSGGNIQVAIDVQFLQSDPFHRRIFHAYREHLRREDTQGLEHVRGTYDQARLFFSPLRETMH